MQEWYYVENGQRLGPIPEDQLRVLVEQGTILADTLVWHAGMKDWRPYGQLTRVVAAQVGLAEGMARCKQCKRALPLQDMVEFQGSFICPTCKNIFFQRVQEGAVRGGGDTSNADLTAAARGALAGSWGPGIGACAVPWLISMATNFVPYLGSIAQLLIGGPLRVGQSIFFLALIRDNQPELGQVFHGFRRFGTSLLATVLVGLLIMLWASILFVPGIILLFVVAHGFKEPTLAFACLAPSIIAVVVAQYRYAQTYFIIADDPDVSAMQAVKLSVEMMKGKKLKLFFLGFRFIGWAMLCVLTLLIGFLWLMPYMMTSFAYFYDDVKGRAVAE